MLKITTYWRVALATATTLAFMAAPAHAGPVIGVLGTAITSIGTGAGVSAASVAYGLLAGALSMGVNMLLAKIMAPKEKNIGIKQKVESGGDNPLSFIVGEYATAGKLAYVNQGGNDLLNMLTLVISLSELPVSSFSTDIWINGELCTIDTSVQTPSSGDFDVDAPGPGFFRITEYDKRDKDDYEHQYCWVRLYDGTQTAADPYLLDTFGADPDKPWTDEMVGRGCAYAIVVCRYSKEGIWSGIPEFKFVLKGIKLYDPRKDSTVGGSGAQRWRDQSTWTFSENAKVWEFNAIRGVYYGGKWVWGGQSQKAPSLDPPNLDDPDAYRFPLSSWFAAMNHCDENVDLAGDAGTIKRYTVGAEITVDQQPIDIVKETNKSCNGFTYEFGGSFKTWAGPFGTSVFSFTDKNTIISEDQTDSLFRPLQETYNGARATYVKPKAGWVMKEAPPRIFDDLQAEDGGYQLIAEFELPMVTNGNQAQRIQRTVVLDSRREINHVLQLPPEAFILEPFDVITWASDRNGYDNKKFVVTSIDDLPNCNQALSFRELNSNDYDWDTEFELPDSVGTLTPVRPGALALDFTVSADQVDRPGGGKDKPAIKIEWTWGLKDVDLKWVKYEVRRSVTQPKVIAHGTFFNAEENERTITSAAFRFGQDFQVRLFAQPERPWRRSAWTGWKDVTLTNIDVPGAPTLTRVSDLADDGTLDFFVDVDWTAVSAEVTYSVRVVSGASTRYYKAEENSLRFPATSGKTYVVAVRSIGADGGTKGDWSSTTSITVTKKNTAPTAPTSLSATGDNHRAYLGWAKSPDSDFRRAIVYRATTNDFTTASEVGRSAGTTYIDDNLANGITRYYWITFEDTSGNESSKFPVSNTGGRSATTARVVDDDTDQTSLGAPTGLALAQAAKDVDEDGKVDIAITATWSALTGAKTYELEITEAGTLIDNLRAANLKKTFKAKSAKLYSVRIRALSFNGTPGAWSSAVTLTPSKKSAAPATPSGLSATSKPKAVRLDWTAATEADFKWARIYRNTVNTPGSATSIGRTKADWFRDDAALVSGTTYYYWVAFVDTSDNEGSKSAVASVAYSGVTTADLEPGSVTDVITDPTAPGTPTGVTLTQRTNIDEDGKAVLELKVTWTAPAGISAKAGYEVNFNDGTDSWNVKSDDLVVRYPVRSNVLYTVKVRAVSFNGVKGSYSSTATITPSKKATAPTTAAGLSASANHKRVKLTWTLCPDNDYKQTRIYRNTVNTFGTASIIGHIKGSAYIDDDIASNTTYFYWVAHVDQSGNVGTASSSATDTTPYILDGDTDPTVLAAPTGLAISQDNIDLDKDGRVDTAILIAWSDSGASAKSYEVEISQSSTSGGSYTVIENRKSKNILVRHPAKATKWYKARVRAFSFNGTPGSWSSLTAAFQPSSKSAAPSNVAWEASNPIVAKPKAIVLRWQEAADTDYKKTVVYRNTSNNSGTAVEIGRVAGTRYKDDDDLVAGTTYYYWAKHLDQSGNLSASFSSVQSITWQLVGDDDTDQSALSVPSAPTLTQTAKDIDEDGKVDIAVKVTWTAVTGAKAYEIEITQGSDVSGIRTKTLSHIFKAKSNKLYSVKVASVSFNGTVSAFSSATTITPTKKSALPSTASGLTVTPKPKGMFLEWTECTDFDYRTTIIKRGGVEIARHKGDSYTDHEELVIGTSYTYTVQHVDTSGNVGTASGGVAGTYRKALPKDVDQSVASENLIYDGDFDSDTIDLWSGPNGTLTNVAVANAPGGGRALLFDRGTSGGTVSMHRQYVNAIPVVGGDAYYGEFAITGEDPLNTPAASAAGAYLRFVFLDETKTPIAGGNGVGYRDFYSNGAIPATFTTYSAVFTLPTSVKYVVPDLYHHSTSTIEYMYVSSIKLKHVIEDKHTNPVAPDVPGVPAISTLASDVDGDGTIDTALRLTLTLPGSGVPVKFYEVEIHRSATLGGTYAAFGPRVHVPAESSGSTLYDFKANQAKFYKARARAIAFNGAKGTYSALTATGVQPLVFSSSVPTPTLTVTPKPKGMYLKWSKWQSNLYLETIITRNATEVARIKGNSWTDNDELTPGSSYTYTVQHVDKQNQTGSASTGQAGTYKQAASTDLQANAVGTRELSPQNWANLFLNSKFSDATLDGWPTNLGLSVVAKGGATAPLNAAPTPFVLAIPSTAGTVDYIGVALIDVNEGDVIHIRGDVAADAGTTGTNQLIMRRFNADGSSSPIGPSPVISPSTSWQTTKGSYTVPAGMVQMYAGVRSGAGGAGTWYWTNFRLTRVATNELLDAESVTDDKTDQTTPDAPGVPSLQQIAADLDDDGSIDIALQATLTLPGTGVPIKFFEVEVQRAATLAGSYAAFGPRIHVPAESSGSTLYQFKANAKKFYKARARAVSFNGSKSAYSALTATGVQPLSYVTAIATPAAPTVALKTKGMLVRWPKCTDKNYKETVVNRTGTGEIWRGRGNRYIDQDDALVAGTGYTYTIQHVSTTDILSTASPASTSVTFDLLGTADLDDGAVTEVKTDPTAPATVTSLTVNTVTADIDGDGSIDAGLSLAIVNPNTGVSIKRYIVEIHRNSAAAPSTYTLWKRDTVEAEDVADTLTTTYTFKANKNRLHKARVRAVAFGGKKGAFSSLTASGVQPTTVSGYNGKTASTPNAVPVANAVQVSWALTDNGAVALDTTIYKETEILIGAVSLAKVKGTFFVDNTARTPGTTYNYTVKHYDIHGNVTTVSAADGALWRNASAVAATGDFDTTALAAPGSFTYTQDTSFDLNGDGTVDMVMKVAWAAITNATSYEVEISRSATAGGTYTVVGLGGITNSLEWRHICNVNWYYKARVRARNAYGQPGNWTSLSTAVQPAAKPSYTSSIVGNVSALDGYIEFLTSVFLRDPDYDHSEFVATSGAGAPSPSALPLAQVQGGGKAYIPAIAIDVPGASWHIWYRNVDRTGNKTAWAECGSSPVTLVGLPYTAAGSAFFNNGNAAIALGDIGDRAFLKNGSGSTISAGSTTTGSQLTYNDTGLTGTVNPTGTWRAQGRVVNGQATEFLRVS